jgi:hypothetical protein
MVNKESWLYFRDSGLLWWVNMILHTLGWAIVYEFDDNNELTDVYPSRVTYRGFTEKINTEGYIKVSKFIKDNADKLYKESQE